MQALERIVIDTNWITILLVLLFACVFLLKGLSAQRLKGSVSSLVNKSFIETEIEDNNSFFNLFQIIIFVLSMFVLSLLMYKIVLYYTVSFEQSFYTFFKIFALIFSYFVIKRFLEFLFSILFMIKNEVNFFLISKSIYLNSVSLILLIAIVLVEYSPINTRFLIYFSALLFSARFLLHIVNNKKLVFSKLFYFILYLCAFEIAPLFILFKLMF